MSFIFSGVWPIRADGLSGTKLSEILNDFVAAWLTTNQSDISAASHAEPPRSLREGGLYFLRGNDPSKNEWQLWIKNGGQGMKLYKTEYDDSKKLWVMEKGLQDGLEIKLGGWIDLDYIDKYRGLAYQMMDRQFDYRAYIYNGYEWINFVNETMIQHVISPDYSGGTNIIKNSDDLAAESRQLNMFRTVQVITLSEDVNFVLDSLAGMEDFTDYYPAGSSTLMILENTDQYVVEFMKWRSHALCKWIGAKPPWYGGVSNKATETFRIWNADNSTLYIKWDN